MKFLPLHDIVVYHSAHFLRGSDPLPHAERVAEFLDVCAIDLAIKEAVIQVRSGPVYPLEQSQALISDFTQRWGPPTVGLEMVSTNGSMETHKWAPALTIHQLLDIVIDLRGSRRVSLPMLSLGFDFQFQLADPVTGHALPGQNWSPENLKEDMFFLPHGFSSIWGNLGESSVLGALISFPFTATDPRLLPYLAYFQGHFPVKLSKKGSSWHWWKVRKDGVKHHRRGAVPTFGGAESLNAHLAGAIKAK